MDMVAMILYDGDGGAHDDGFGATMFGYAHDVYSVMVDGDYGDGAYLLVDGALAFDDGLGAMPLMEMTCDD
ncbi:unnamed protein product, partial [Adineta steineri]